MRIPTTRLPARFREVVEAIEGINNVPAELSLPIALSIAAYACQGRYDVDSEEFGVRQLMLYTIGIAPSGSLKSELFRLLGAGAQRYATDCLPRYEVARAEYLAKKASWEIDLTAARKEKDSATREQLLFALMAKEPKAPLSVNRILDSVTNVGLIKTLARTEPSAILMSPDAGAFFGSYALKSDEAKQQFATNLSKLWNAERVDRNTSEDELVLHGVRLSILMLVQEELVREFLGNPLFQAQGLTARFLVSRCPRYQVANDSLLDTQAKARRERSKLRLSGFNDRVYQLLRQGLAYDDAGRLVTTTLRMNAEALTLYDTFRMSVTANERNSEDHPFFQRCPEHCLRLAGVLSAFEGRQDIGEEEMGCAIELLRYFMNVWQTMDTTDTAASAKEFPIVEALTKWALKRGGTFIKRDLDRAGPNIWRTADKSLREAVLSRMIEDEMVAVLETKNGSGVTVRTFELSQK